jgi:HsdM N-terminal domain
VSSHHTTPANDSLDHTPDIARSLEAIQQPIRHDHITNNAALHDNDDGHRIRHVASTTPTRTQTSHDATAPAKILRGKTAGQDYKNYILSLMFYKRLCDQWENEADEAIAEQERLHQSTFMPGS